LVLGVVEPHARAAVKDQHSFEAYTELLRWWLARSRRTCAIVFSMDSRHIGLYPGLAEDGGEVFTRFGQRGPDERADIGTALLSG